MTKQDIAGLKIDAVTKQQLLTVIRERMTVGQKTWLTTVYSEFLYAGLRDSKILDMLNQADIAVADGIGIFWAKKYLEIPLAAKSYWGKILQGLWQLKYSLAAILFNPRWIKSALPEKIVGADLVWDLAKLAADNSQSIYLLGAFGNTPKIVAEKLATRLIHGREYNKSLTIAGWSNKNPDDPTVIDDINKSGADILLVAYGPIKQEKWIYENLAGLNVKLAVGVGGSFDYIAGAKSAPPKFIRSVGLEWLWRLFTQPHRVKRIINATFGLMAYLLRYKIFYSYPIRKNSVAVILNNRGKVFVGRKSGSRVDIISSNDPEKWKNYWQLPQGGIDDNENVEQAVEREAKEETGMDNLKFIKFSKKTNTYIWNNALRKLFGKNSTYRFKGQTQTIAYLKYQGDDRIQLPSGEEFIDYQWAEPDDLDKIIHPERINLTKIVQEDLKDLA